MNGIHDMGGMHGMGPIRSAKDEPVFHQPWEARTFALTRAFRVQFPDKSNLDASRHALEQLAPAEYLRMSYYEKWLVRLLDQVVNQGLATQSEINSGESASGSRQFKPVLTADIVPAMIAKGSSARRDVRIDARFAAGERVRARNMNPAGHTRLPRYARGKAGTIMRDHGVFVFPDTRAHFQGDKPQHVYSVRFDAQELWGGNANPHDAIYVDMWEDYLEQA